MQKILLISGCSHTSGSEINGVEDSVYNRQHSFGNQLARKLDRIPINIAQAGSTNSAIARGILNWFRTQYDSSYMDVRVLASWTESARIEAPRQGYEAADFQSGNRSVDWFDPSSDFYYRINMGLEGHKPEEKDIFKGFHEFIARNPVFMEIYSAMQVIILQNYLKTNNIKYVMCNAMHMFTTPEPHLDNYLQFVDSSKYYNMLNNEQSFYIKYKNLGYTNPKAKYWHHNEEPHKLYAEELYNYIGDNKCF